MAWSTPLTAVSNAALTASQWNASVRDNLLETAPAKATTAGRLMVTTGANAIAERVPGYNFIGTAETTASTTYADLATVGPSVSATSGTRAIVAITSDIWGSAVGYIYASLEASGASAVTAVDANAITLRIVTGADASSGCKISVTNMFSTLTSGANVFTMKYRVSTGTGRFSGRNLVVIPL